MNKKFWATTFTLTGTIMGAGILGIPYVFAQSGFLVGLFWLVVLGAVMIFVNLALGELTLRTKGVHQLSGYAEKYLGCWGKYAMFFAMFFGIYSALLAYLVGEGESLAKLFPGGINPVFFGIAFWLVMTLLLREGLKGLKKIETWGVLGIIVIILGFFIKLLPQVQPSNLLIVNPPNFALPIGVILFALLGFTSIPELRQEIKGQEKFFKKAIVVGILIPIFLYILFSSIFVGILGKTVTEVATLSFGPFITILGIFTMLTSYFVLSYSIRDTFKYDFKTSKRVNFFFTSLVPLILYILVSKFNILGFVSILGIGGVISVGLTGILILLMSKKAKAKTRNGKNPEIQMPITWPVIFLLIFIFIAGIIIEFIL
ncbi:MAG: aromatic amino acid transport family protein [Nanoarchaeota archaeon]|nr:aromatic amino acid transport family protein [Nanoarchaeota archaeon]